MGKLGYARFPAFEMDDRTLAHLAWVISLRLSRNEAFFVTWRNATDAGGGRTSIWIERRIPVHFTYSTRKRIELNRRWLEELQRSANQPEGLFLTDEPSD